MIASVLSVRRAGVNTKAIQVNQEQFHNHQMWLTQRDYAIPVITRGQSIRINVIDQRTLNELKPLVALRVRVEYWNLKLQLTEGSPVLRPCPPSQYRRTLHPKNSGTSSLMLPVTN